MLPSAEAEFVSHGHEEFFIVLRGEVVCLLKIPDGLVSLRPQIPHRLHAAGPDAASIHLPYSGYGATDAESDTFLRRMVVR